MHISEPRPIGRLFLLALAMTGLASCANTPSDSAADLMHRASAIMQRASTIGVLQSESAFTVLQRANVAMGAHNLRSITYSGTGSGATFGQAYRAGEAWPKINYSSFMRTADYAQTAFREDAARSRAEANGGGAIPLLGTGEQRTSGWMRGASAWNMAGTTAMPAPLALTARTHDLWTTPHGVIKAALANEPTVRMRSDGDRRLAAVSFQVPGQFKATVLINADGLVEQIDSVLPNPVMGDTASTIRFSEYRDFSGVMFPMRIEQNMGGFPVLDLAVKDVRPNAVAGIEIPANVPAHAEQINATKVADGVWFLAGGSHNSVAIEMAQDLIVVESPLYDGRSAPMLAEARKLANGKPVRFVINSHHHFDHSGGLRTALAEGAILITSEQARPWFQTVLGNPNRIAPDALRKSGRGGSIIGVVGKREFTDGKRVVEVHAIESGVHADGFLMVYLPAERILIEADAYTPGPPNAPTPSPINGNNLNLVQNIERLGLKVETILPLHGRIAAIADLYGAVGKKP